MASVDGLRPARKSTGENKIINLFADLAIEAALNDKIGYDQGTAGNSADRYTFRQQMKAVGYRPSKITKPCECDCSEGTIVLIQAVGHLKGIKELQECNATYTGNMMIISILQRERNILQFCRDDT